MNDDALELELRALYRAEMDESVRAPAELRDDVRAIPMRAPARRPRGIGRPTMLLIAAAIAATAVAGSAIVGTGILRRARVAPPPSTAVVVAPTPPGSASIVPEPSPVFTATPVLGGGPILAVLPHPGAPTCNTTAAPYDVVTVDPATGATTLLGTTSSECAVRQLGAFWAANRTKILLLDLDTPRQLDLLTTTEAGRRLPVVCCDLPAYSSVWEDGGGSGQGWSISPGGDRIAAVHTTKPNRGDAIVVSDIDGQNVRRLALPDGADARGGLAWSPDEGTIAVAACRPCNTAQHGQPANADERWHLYLVDVNGSGVRTLLSTAAGETASQPAWAPDGANLAAVVTQCGAGEIPPDCKIERTRSSVALIDIASGAPKTLVPPSDFGPGVEIVGPSWAPDGGRVRFTADDVNRDRAITSTVVTDGSRLTTVVDGAVLAWSPDGQWFLVRRDPMKETVSVGSIHGDPLRELGPFSAVDW